MWKVSNYGEGSYTPAHCHRSCEKCQTMTKAYLHTTDFNFNFCNFATWQLAWQHSWQLSWQLQLLCKSSMQAAELFRVMINLLSCHTRRHLHRNSHLKTWHQDLHRNSHRSSTQLSQLICATIRWATMARMALQSRSLDNGRKHKSGPYQVTWRPSHCAKESIACQPNRVERGT